MRRWWWEWRASRLKTRLKWANTVLEAHKRFPANTYFESNSSVRRDFEKKITRLSFKLVLYTALLEGELPKAQLLEE